MKGLHGILLMSWLEGEQQEEEEVMVVEERY